MKIGEYPRMSSVEDTDVFVFSRPSDGTKSIRVADLINIITDRVSTEGLLNKFYPVGSIYISVNSTSPEEIMGGEWEAINGRFLVAEGSNGQTENALLNLTAGDIGGETKHTLTVLEMPSHSHRQYVTANNGTAAIRRDYSSDGNSAIYDQGCYTQANGGSQPHNNLPPYLAVYMWKRTA